MSAGPASSPSPSRDADRRHRQELASLARGLMRDMPTGTDMTTSVSAGNQLSDRRVELVPTEPVHVPSKFTAPSAAFRLSDPAQC